MGLSGRACATEMVCPLMVTMMVSVLVDGAVERVGCWIEGMLLPCIYGGRASCSGEGAGSTKVTAIDPSLLLW